MDKLKKGKIMRQNKQVTTCADCIHESACQAWNCGTLHNANANNCKNHETVKESAAYFIGYREGKNEN